MLKFQLLSMLAMHHFNYTRVVVCIFLRFSTLTIVKSIDLVYNEPSCSQTQLNLNVLVIGYGIHSGEDYWLVKNG
jgi:hypothetical protein